MVAIVTGASSGLGLSIAELLRSRGTQVVGVSRRAAADVSGDASKRDTAVRAIEAAERLGTIDLLVNCAGAGIFGPAGSYDHYAIATIINSNLIATINFCELLFPRFKEHGGTIVNILSTAALMGTITTPLLDIEEGVRLKGTCEAQGLHGQKSSKESLQRPAEQNKVMISQYGEL